MGLSAKKRPQNKGVSKKQDEAPQDLLQYPINRVVEQNRLKTVIKNLSLLKLFNSSNPRIQQLYSLAKGYWNLLLKVPKMLYISYGDNTVYNNKTQSHKALQKPRCPKQWRKLQSTGEHKEMKPNKSKTKVVSGVKKVAKRSPGAAPRKGEQAKQADAKALRNHSLALSPGTRGSQAAKGKSQVVFPKPYHLKMPMEDKKVAGRANRCVWFKGLPTRIHLPGPRVMCRVSSLRPITRCCTRYCSANLELPRYHPYWV
ncbi:PREDICTED: TP53-target gene 5 protein [Elephantulus edwardii]|uniref:TP53-target gene 5 protein n=1 Tax=Elephantulus edwardii TaxID=28737 RepID=UPI0003F09B4C|nr:PREDICTED: TP53-target gene 5 protein [Elephantulus edwardii]